MQDLKTLLEADAKATKALEAKLSERDQADIVTKDEIKSIREELAAVKLARQEAETSLKTAVDEAKAAAEEAATKAGRFGASGEAIDEAEVAHKAAFIEYLRHHKDYDAQKSLKEAEAKAVTGSTNASGGFAVPTMLAADINRRMEAASVMRSLVNIVTVGTSDYREIVDKLGMGYAWVGEAGARADSATPSIYEAVPTQGTIYAYPKATEESLDDIFFDVAGWLAKSAGTAMATGKDAAIVSGNGTDKPTGFLNGTPVVTADGTRANQVLQFVASGAAANFGTDPHGNLLDTLFAMKAAHRANATWVMNSLTAATLLGVKDTTGNPIWWQTGLMEALTAFWVALWLSARPCRISARMPSLWLLAIGPMGIPSLSATECG